MTEFVLDIETNGLHNPTEIHCAVLRNITDGTVHVYEQPTREGDRLRDVLRDCSHLVGHNILGFDLPVVRSLLGVDPSCRVTDTLVVSRLLHYGREGGHSLRALGDSLGFPKGEFTGPWDVYTEEMRDYCIRDTEVTLKLYQKFLPYLNNPSWAQALEIEHTMARLNHEMSTNGFHFDISSARELHSSICLELERLDKELRTAFPPRSRLVREITPRATAHGTIHRGDFRWLVDGDLTPFAVGHPFSLIQWEAFNPGSPKQIVERLNEAGWRPTEKTKGHIQAERERNTERLQHFRQYGWKVSEANLLTLPESAPPAAQKLVRRLLLDSRRSTLEEWMTAYSEASGRIHGTFNHIGAWTHRMSHSAPNMANIPAGNTPYAHEMRSMWQVPDDKLLVGVDADGIQLRILAHYLNDLEFTEELINGRKEDGTDAHSRNVQRLGLNHITRDDAKTFIYAFLLGAGTGKVAEILRCKPKVAKASVERFIEAIPGLKHLKGYQIPRDASRGYFEGLDKRLVICNNEHLMLAGYLQNGESTVMKHATQWWYNRLTRERIPFKLVNFVHDEWQTEVPNDLDLAKYIAEVQADSIRTVGEMLELRCPMAGSVLNTHKQLAIGKNWSETH